MNVELNNRPYWEHLEQIMERVFDAKIKPALEPLEKDMAVLKTDVAVLKTDVAVLKTDVAVLKIDVAELKEDVSVLKEDVSILKAEVNSINVKLDNQVFPGLKWLAKGHAINAERLSVLEERWIVEEGIRKLAEM